MTEKKGGDVMANWLDILLSKTTAYKDIQKLRIGISNRIWMIENRDKWRKRRHLPPIKILPDEKEVITTVLGIIKEGWEGVIGKERKLGREISELVEAHSPIWSYWLKNVRGVGSLSTGLLYHHLHDKTFPSRSHLLKFCGLHTENGKAAKRVRGKKLCYNPIRKADMLLIGENLIKQRSLYKQIFDQEREKYIERYPEYVLPPGKKWDDFPPEDQHPKRIYKMARRNVTKLFLSHLWEVCWKLCYPEEKIPRPMHCQNRPLGDDEIIPPYYSFISLDDYMTEEETMEYVRRLDKPVRLV